MHIAAQTQQIGIAFHEPGRVPALHQMAASPVTPVEVDRVRRFQPVHESAEVGPRRLQHEMNVVGHQAIQVETHLETDHALLQHAQKTLPIGVVPEDVPPFVPSCRHVVHGPFILDPLRLAILPILSSLWLHFQRFPRGFLIRTIPQGPFQCLTLATRSSRPVSMPDPGYPWKDATATLGCSVPRTRASIAFGALAPAGSPGKCSGMSLCRASWWSIGTRAITGCPVPSSIAMPTCCGM